MFTVHVYTTYERNSIAFVLDLIALALCLPGNEIYACGLWIVRSLRSPVAICAVSVCV